MTKWIFAQASVQGQSHIQRDIPCQDACGVYIDPQKQWGIAVVSDGAGSASHSHLGSHFLVHACMDRFKKEVSYFSGGQAIDTSTWNHWAKHFSLNIHQQYKEYASEQSLQLTDLAATLIFIVFHPDRLLVAHVGDGRAACKRVGHNWEPIMVPFRGEEVNETIFFSSSLWMDDPKGILFKTSIIHGPIESFALMTDGCERASFEVNIFDEILQKFVDPNQPFQHFFDPNIAGLKQLYQEKKDQAFMDAVWSQYLKKGNRSLATEADDKTMILFHYVSEL